MALLSSSLPAFTHDTFSRPIITYFDEERDYDFKEDDSGLVLKDLGRSKGMERTRYLETRSLKISKAATDKITTTAFFTEIRNSKIKEIHVTGILYLHHCEDEIDTVKATGDIYIYKVKSISKVFSDGNIYNIKNLLKDGSPVSIRSIQAKKIIFIYHIDKQNADCFTLRNIEIGGPLEIDPRIKKVYIEGNCSKVPEIIFKEGSSGNKVIIEKGAIFCGAVTNGVLEDLN